MMFSLLHTFCLHFYLINIHIFDYPDSRLSGQFTEVPTSPDNRSSTEFLTGQIAGLAVCLTANALESFPLNVLPTRW